MNRLRTLEDLDLGKLGGKLVLVRVDFNVPISGGEVGDATRIEAALPTLSDLRAAGARLLLVSHLGRPKGVPDPEFSLEPVARKLGERLGADVSFASDCIGEARAEAAAALADGEVCLLENVRFHAGETRNDPEFVAALAAGIDVYVDDAFGTAHRAHASTAGVAERTPNRAAGRLLVAEVEALGRLLDEPDRPFAAIVGGAKIEGKVDTLQNLLPRLDRLALGGGMANTFLAARGLDLRNSLVEPDRIELAGEILADAAARGIEVVLPSDVVVADDFAEPSRIETIGAHAIPEGMMALDIGPATRATIAAAVMDTGTVFWNGPMGVFEKPPFDEGTVAVARAVAECGAFSVLGGGETVAAVNRAGVADRIGHVSTGGGASLEFLAGRALPGVEVLRAGGDS